MSEKEALFIDDIRVGNSVVACSSVVKEYYESLQSVLVFKNKIIKEG